MNEEEAEEFFDSLEGKGELKEPFKIPKKPKEEEKIPEKPKEEDKIPETEDGEIQEEEEDEETIRPMKRIRSIKEDKGDCEKKGGSPASKKIKNSPPFNNPNDPLGLESPETRAPTTYGAVKAERAESWVHTYSGPLPQELLSQCSWTHCGPCGINFNSPIVSRTHYLGRNHEKRVAGWLEHWSNRTKQKPPVKLERYTQAESVDENERYCDLCGIDLSSKIVAIAHYQGKVHAKQKNRKEAGLMVKSDYKVKEDPTGRFGFGKTFIKAKETTADIDNSSKQKAGFFCVPCNAEFVTGDEYQEHLFGEKHRITTQDSNSAPMYYCKDCSLQCADGASFQKHLSSFDHGIKSIRADVDAAQNDFQNFMEKTGKHSYKCTLCSVECPGIEAAQDHIKGKSHKRKLNLVSGGGVKAAAAAATPCPPNGTAAAPPSGEAAALAPNVAAAGALPSLPGFRCEICQIETTDLAGLEQHKNGKKHKKKAAAAFLAEAKKEST